MGVAERREREKEKRRTDIMNVSLKFFSGNGFELTSMDQIAEKLELSKGTLYLYFKSKDDLLLALAEKGLSLLLEEFLKVKKMKIPPGEKLRQIGITYFQFNKKHLDYLYILQKSESVDINSKNIPANYNRFVETSSMCHTVVADVIQEGISDGTFREDINKFEMSFILWATTSGIIRSAGITKTLCSKQFDFEAEYILEKFWKTMMENILSENIEDLK